MPPEDARLVADTLVQADLWGHQSHGVLRLPWYLARLKAGVCTAVAAPSFVVDAGAVAVIDGGDAMGQVLTAHAMRDAIRRAKAHGIAAVALRNSNHFGTALYFTLMAARAGCVAFLSTNASPAMAPWGGRQKAVGTNPWSWAAPAGKYAPMVLDIANTGVARGKIYLARNRGEQIPDSWAMDGEGNITTDPTDAINGVILPMAGHKGYAITFMMDVLSGALTGSNTGSRVGGPYEPEKVSGAGHLFIAIDVAAMGSTEDYLDSVGQLIDEVKTTPLAPGNNEIFYPGELEDRNAHHNLTAGGVALPDQTRADLDKLGKGLGISTNF